MIDRRSKRSSHRSFSSRRFSSRGWKAEAAILWSSQGLALLGTSISQFTLIWWLTERTGSAIWLSVAAIGLLVPDVFILPFIGPIIDRYSRKRILIAANAAIAVVSAIGTVLLTVEAVAPAAVVAILFLRTLANSFRWPALQALATDIVPADQLTRVNAIDYILRGSTNVLGPVFAAWMIRALPVAASLSIDFLAAAAGIALLLTLTVRESVFEGGRRGSVRAKFRSSLRSLRNGLRYVLTEPGLLPFLGYVSITNLLLVPIESLMPLMVSDYFLSDVESLSMMQISFGLGTVIGGLILGVWGGFRSQIRSALLGDLVYTLGVLLIGRCAPGQLPLAILGWGISGIGDSLSVANLNALIQKHTRPELQGRVFSISTGLISVWVPVTMLFVGPIAERVGVHFWYGFAGFGMLALMIGVLFVPAFYRYEERETVGARGFAEKSAS